MNTYYPKFLKIFAFVMGLLLSATVHADIYTYDKLDRLIRVDYSSGQIVTYRYDTAGNILGIENQMPTYTLQGYVHNQSGLPVPGVRVEIDNLAGLSDTQGFYELPGVPAGDHSVAFIKDGYAGETASVTVNAAGNATLNVNLSRGGIQIDTGRGSSTFVLQEDGQVLAWGTNIYANLGDGTTTSRNHPVTVANLEDAALLASWSHTTALTHNGELFSWGRNYYGQLGAGTTADASLLPIPVKDAQGDPLVNVVEHTSMSALTADGRLWMWGDTAGGANNGAYGQTFYHAVPMSYSDGTPVTDIVSLQQGLTLNSAIRADGAVLTWGSTVGESRFADGGAVARTTEAQVSVAVDENGETVTGVVDVAIEARHVLALKADGTMLAWGNNLDGQLGDGTDIDRLYAVAVRDKNGKFIRDIKAIDVGTNLSIALKEDGTVLAWGDKKGLGRGDIGGFPGVEMVVTDGENYYANLPDYVIDDNGDPIENIVDVTASGYGSSVLALKADGTLLGWGNNEFGQLGDGTTEKRYHPVAVTYDTGDIVTGVTQIDYSGNHNIALTETGNLLSWGANDAGQLGDGTTISRYNPVQVVNADGTPVELEIQVDVPISVSLQIAAIDNVSGNMELAPEGASGGLPATGTVKINGQTVPSSWTADRVRFNLFETAAPETLLQPIEFEVFDKNGGQLFKGYYPFMDVPPYAWYTAGVMNLWKAGMLDNMPNSLFEPLAPVSRKNFATLFARVAADAPGQNAAAFPVPAEAPYPDVPVSNPSAPFIQYLKELGLLRPCDAAGNFCPKQEILRKDAVEFVALAGGGETLTAFLNGGQPTEPFTDVMDRNAGYYPYVYTAAEKEWLHGYADNTFRPFQALTNGEIAKLISLAASGPMAVISTDEPEPVVAEVSPPSAMKDQPVVFSVDIANAPDAIRFVLESCNGIKLLSKTAEQQQFRCTPVSSGNLQGVIEDQANGNVLFNFTVAVSTALSKASSPSLQVTGATSIQVIWDDNAPLYELWRSSEADYGNFVRAYCGPDASYADVGLMPDTGYFYQLKAGNASASCTDEVTGWSAFSDGRGQRTEAAPVPPAEPVPTAPTPSLTVTGSAAIQIIWDDNADIYELQRSSDANYDSFVRVYCGSAALHADAGLMPDTGYFYKLKAGNGSASCTDGVTGWSAFSDGRGQKTEPALSVPAVSSVSPLTASLNQSTVFTVQGSNLPDSTAFWIGECADLVSLGGTAEQRQFRCTPSYSTGIKDGVAKDKSGGTELYNFSVTVYPPVPTVFFVSPLAASLNQSTIFTVQGSNLPDSTAFWIAECADLVSLGGTAEQRQFRCTPSYSTGIKDGVAKDKSGGTELYNFSVTVSPPAPTVSSVSPLVAS
ncbi:MAG: hypothetical protein GY862_34635, partial [Gammaproteobacteria bacterium]|nr:hypothetical protein [Gammaproteobacteria bacterium]